MSVLQTARRWAQTNPQLATSLVAMAVFGGFAAATGDLASIDWDPSGGTSSWQGP